MAYMVLFIFFLAGAAFGSFANVLALRYRDGKSALRGRSACPACGCVLSLWEAAPLVGFLVLRGKCRHCAVRLPWRYPATEVAGGLLFAGVAWRFPAVDALFLCFLAFILLAIALADADTQEIPDGWVLAGIVAGVAWVALGHAFPVAVSHAPSWEAAGLGILAGALPLLLLDGVTRLVIKKPAFGLGDVKLMAMAGIWLGWAPMGRVFFFAFVGGGAWAVVLLLRGRAVRGDYLAFGPFLCAGIGLALIWAA